VKRIHPSEITPEHVYLNRRQFMTGVGAVVLSGVLGGCAEETPQPTTPAAAPTAAATVPAATPTAAAAATAPGGTADELGNPLTPHDSVITYNNFYEFTLSKEGVALLAQDFQTNPWQVEVGGLVRKPRTFDLDDLAKFELEERIYRLRCVEAWSMVVPWNGFPLWKLLDAVEPTSEAQYVRFQTLLDPESMPGQRQRSLDWPYVEGLRMDEARHDLTLLATGLYGKPLPPQNGAPLRLVVPWKYGFKYIKSIVRIDLVAEMPVSSWMAAAANEYGFYANVNPDVPHPRWSQASERSITDGKRYKTLLFNGYGEEVAHLYEGLDLEANF